MASLIQLQNLSQVKSNPLLTQQSPQPASTRPKLSLCLLEQLFKNFYRPIIQYNSPIKSSFTINFLVPIFQKKQIWVQCQIHDDYSLMVMRSILLNGSHLKIALSSEIIKNSCRTVALINSMATKSNFIVSLNPINGQINWKRPEKVLDLNPKTILSLIKEYCSKLVELMMTFSGFLFYACKSISFKYFLQHAPESLKRYYLCERGEIFLYSEIKQYLPFLSQGLKSQKNSKERGNNDAGSSLNDSESVLLSSFQQYHKIERGNILYTFSNFCGRQSPYLKEINKMVVLKDLIYPSPRQQGGKSVIKNINIISDQREKEIVLKQGYKIKTSIVPMKFTCTKSEETIKKKSIFNIREEKINTDRKKNQEELVFDKYLVVKEPLNPKTTTKFSKIQHQKHILSIFNGDYCPYLPKYYQTTQENSLYKNSLIIEYLQSLTLHEVVQIKKSTLSQISKIRILMHLSNALRFLQSYQVVHNDLSPNNIFVVADYMVKIIDFGQSFCERVTVRQVFSQNEVNNSKQFQYNPGKTYMFSSPQVYNRAANFTSKQDMYSLGVICFKLFFGYYPLTCNENHLENLFKNSNYMQSFIFAPEQIQDLGNTQILVIIINLVMRLMNPIEERRPFSVWAHYIFKKLMMAQRM